MATVAKYRVERYRSATGRWEPCHTQRHPGGRTYATFAAAEERLRKLVASGAAPDRIRVAAVTEEAA